MKDFEAIAAQALQGIGASVPEDLATQFYTGEGDDKTLKEDAGSILTDLLKGHVTGILTQKQKEKLNEAGRAKKEVLSSAEAKLRPFVEGSDEMEFD